MSRLLPILLLVVVLLLLLGLSHCATSGDTKPIHVDCMNNVTLPRGSPFNGLVETLLSSLPPAAESSGGFMVDTLGFEANFGYGMAQCRADVNASECRACLDAAARDLRGWCPGHQSAMAVYEACLLRYSNETFFRAMDKSVSVTECGAAQNETQRERLGPHLNDLLINLTGRAAYRSNKTRFAAGAVEVSPTEKIYGMVQCTRDLNPDDCHLCLSSAVLSMLYYCDQMYFRSCFVRHEAYPFYDAKAAAAAEVAV